MSKLAALLEARKASDPAANLANPANPHAPISSFSNFSRPPPQNFTPELERRIRRMAQRWAYTPTETQDVLERARANPIGWLSAVAYDEEREAVSAIRSSMA